MKKKTATPCNTDFIDCKENKLEINIWAPRIMKKKPRERKYQNGK